ncbi:hypothetical protein [Streptomyces actinomycinicus]|nr:hypothetical protein [Streptomyces actinomycinicus]
MNVSLDGRSVKERLQGGEPAFSVLARATACGRSLTYGSGTASGMAV